MNKKGTTQWTMAKLMTLVLAVVLLVLIIYGVQNRGFGPLMDNIEGRYNEVLILLGFRDDGMVTCGDAFPESIDGMSGDFYPCEDSCEFVLSNPGSLLGFSNFSVKDGGISVSGVGMSDSDEAYRFGSAEAERHKIAYDLLSDSFGEFLASEFGDGMSEDEFVEAMNFDVGRTFVIESRHYLDEVYEYNGENWNNGKISGSKFKGKSGTSRDSSVFSDFYKSYSKGKAYWRFNEVDSLVDDVVLVGDVDRKGFEEWFYETKSDFEIKRLAGEFSVWKIEDDGTWNKDMVYMWDGEKWKGTIPVTGYTESFGELEVVDVLYERYKENRDRVYWWYDDGGVRRRVVSDVNIKDRVPLMSKDELGSWLDRMRGGWVVQKKAQDSVIGSLSVFFSITDAAGSFAGETVPVLSCTMISDNGHRFPAICFKIDREEFGVYYKNGKAALSYNGEDSIVSDFVAIEDWEDFVKINKIYDHFKLRRCGI